MTRRQTLRLSPLDQRPGESEEEHIARLTAIDVANNARDLAYLHVSNTDPRQIADDLAQADSFDDLKAVMVRIVDRMILTEDQKGGPE